MNKRIAIIRIKGDCDIKQTVRDTFTMLRLYNKNTCVIITSTPSYLGMLMKVKDCVTWGEIDEATFKALVLKRGKLPAKQKLDDKYILEKTNLATDDFIKQYFDFKKELSDIPGLKPFFKLNPPIKGFERKGTKKPFSQGGALGYRKDKINELIKRMI